MIRNLGNRDGGLDINEITDLCVKHVLEGMRGNLRGHSIGRSHCARTASLKAIRPALRYFPSP
jgi:hypothetical protein